MPRQSTALRGSQGPRDFSPGVIKPKEDGAILILSNTSEALFGIFSDVRGRQPRNEHSSALEPCVLREAQLTWPLP